MSKLAFALAMLLCMSFAFAWITLPSCVANYSLLGVNFAFTTEGQNIGCTPTQSFIPTIVDSWNCNPSIITGTGYCTPTYYSSTDFGMVAHVASGGIGSSESVGLTPDLSSAAVGSILFINATCDSGAGSHPGDYGTANLTYNISNGTDSIQAAIVVCICNPEPGGCDDAKDNNTASFTVTSLSPFTISNGTDSIPNVNSFSINELVKGVNTGPSVTLTAHSQNFSRTSNLDMTDTVPEGLLGNVSPYTYVSLYSSNIVRSDFTTSKTTLNPDPTNYCRALLTYSDFTQSYLVVPKITYNPSVDAFGNFYNVSNSLAYIKNNTLTYILGQDNKWYAVPAFSCIDYTTVYTISVLAYNGSSFNLGGGNASGTGIPTGLTQILVLDPAYAPITGAAITISAWNNQTNTFNTLGTYYTLAAGYIWQLLTPNTQLYQFNVSANGMNQTYTSNIACGTYSGSCYVVLEMGNHSNVGYATYTGSNATCLWNGTTGLLNCSTITPASSTSLAATMLNQTNYNLTFCNTSVAGTTPLTCAFPLTNGNCYNFEYSAILPTGENPILVAGQICITAPTPAPINGDGIWFAFIITGGLALVGLALGPVGIMLGVAGGVLISLAMGMLTGINAVGGILVLAACFVGIGLINHTPGA